MASSALSCSRALLLTLLVAVTPVPGATEQQRVSLTATAIECYPAPAPTNVSAFGANVRSLLAKLPSATAPTGFASLHSGGRSDRAFARGLCFGDAKPLECGHCLSVAASNLTSGCGANSHRRAGIWSDGCFVSYADTNATTSSEDAFRARVISGPADALASSADLQRFAADAQLLPLYAAVSDNMLAVTNATALASYYAARSTVRVLAQCARDLTAAECARCIDYSARVAAMCCWGLDPWRDGMAAAVVGFNCYLRFEVSASPVPLAQVVAGQEHLARVVAASPARSTSLAVPLILAAPRSANRSSHIPAPLRPRSPEPKVVAGPQIVPGCRLLRSSSAPKIVEAQDRLPAVPWPSASTPNSAGAPGRQVVSGTASRPRSSAPKFTGAPGRPRSSFSSQHLCAKARRCTRSSPAQVLAPDKDQFETNFNS